MLLVIVLKGCPGIGKTTLALELARHLRIPIVCKDYIRDHSIHLERTVKQLFGANELCWDTNDFCYQVMNTFVEGQLKAGLDVIVDSPLSKERYYRQLRQVASHFGAKLAMFECFLEEAEWKRRLDERRNNCSESEHRPQHWHQVQALVEEYESSFEYPLEKGDTCLALDLNASIGDLLQQISNQLERLQNESL